VTHLPSRENLMWVGIGAGLAAAAHPFDDNVNRSLVGSKSADRIFKAGEVIGELGPLLGSATATYAIGRLRDEPRVSHVGMDLIRARAISEGLTQTLKSATRRERPDHSGRNSFHPVTRPIRLPWPRPWSVISTGDISPPRTCSPRTSRSRDSLPTAIGSAMRCSVAPSESSRDGR